MRHTYPPFDDTELSAGFAFLRQSRAYRDLMPPKKILKVDWFLLRAIGNEVERRRTPDVVLPMLVGSVVREFVPDVNRPTRQLGMAYRDAIMHMFRRRKDFQATKRARSKAKNSHPPVDQCGQVRLL